MLAEVVLKNEAAYAASKPANNAGRLRFSNMDESGDSFVLARVTASSRDKNSSHWRKESMSNTFAQQITNPLRGRKMMGAMFVLAIAFTMVNQAAAQVTPPQTPDTIAVPVGNAAFLVGHAFGSQGYTCLPTATGGTAWNPIARPEATLFSDILGSQFQIITHFQSINENPKQGITPPLSGNATWQSSLDSSRVWAVKSAGIDAGTDAASCPNSGSIQCLLLQSVGNKKGPTGGNLLFNTTFIQRLNTRGGAVPTTACTVGQTQLVPYTADYFFFRAVKE
jgi:hypothetical protein